MSEQAPLKKDTVDVVNTYENTQQDVIRITEDKLVLKLRNFLERLQKCYEWHLPASYLVGIALTLTTADFKDALKVPKEVWNSFFLFLTVLCVFSLAKALVYRKKKPTIEELVNDIKNSIKPDAGS